MGETVTLTLTADDTADWDSFHTACVEKLGFPTYYGRNPDAWDDCARGSDYGPFALDAPCAAIALNLPRRDGFSGEAREIVDFVYGAVPDANSFRLKHGAPLIALVAVPVEGRI